MTDRLEIDSGDPIPNIDRHFRIMAGPGAGKTYWLARHIESVVARSDRLSIASRVACISYTNVAVDEIRRRLGAAQDRVEVSTIHSFLYRNVVKPYLHLLCSEDPHSSLAFAMVDGHDEHRPSYAKLDQWLRGIDEAWVLQKKFASQMHELRKRLCEMTWTMPAGNESWIVTVRRDEWGTALKRICQPAHLLEYKQLYWKDGVVDHEDVLYFAYQILSKYPLLREFLAARFPYVFIDEFQDTLPIQTSVVKWFAESGSTVGVIGDTEQSIYGFLNARPDHFSAFNLPDLLDIRMKGNRRSTNSIVAFLNRVRSDGMSQHSVRAIDGDPVKVVIGDPQLAIDRIHASLPEGEELWVLARKGRDVVRLRSSEMTNVGDLWTAFYECDRNRARFVEHLIDNTELARANEIGTALQRLTRGLGGRKGLRDPFDGGEHVVGLRCRGLAVALLESILTEYDTLRSRPLLEFYAVCQTCVARLLPATRLKNVKAGHFKTFASGTTYAALADSLHTQEERRRIRTIHKAKGSEAVNIALYIEDSERAKHLSDPTTELDEERRVTYVALSRARDRLFITASEASNVNVDALRAMGVAVESVP